MSNLGPLVPGAIFKEDLINSNGGSIGAFNPMNWNPGYVNHELQYYKPENAYKENGNIVIKAERRADGSIVSARYSQCQLIFNLFVTHELLFMISKILNN